MEPVTAILDRLAEAVGAANQTELATYLGATQSTVSSWKQRGTIPIKQLMEVAESKEISLDYLLLGKSSRKERINIDLFEKVVAYMSSGASPIDVFGGTAGAKFAQFAALLYNLAVILPSGPKQEQGIELAVRMAIRAQAKASLRNPAHRDLAEKFPEAAAMLAEAQREAIAEQTALINKLTGDDSFKSGSDSDAMRSETNDMNKTSATKD